MKPIKPVSVSKGGFAFCRYSLAVVLWVAFFFKIKHLITFSFIVLFLSYLLKVGRAPMILLYTYTVDKIFKSKKEFLDENSMRFAHLLASIFLFVILVFLYFINEKIGYGILFVFCIVKTLGAIGFCTASKLYNCMNSGGCCSFLGGKND